MTEKAFSEAFNIMWHDILVPTIREEVERNIDAKKDELKNHVLFHFRQQEKLRAAKQVSEAVGILVEGAK